jgi:carbamoyl-phosphate synthase large subunit
MKRLPYCTTMMAARAAVGAMEAAREGAPTVVPLQEYHRASR